MCACSEGPVSPRQLGVETEGPVRSCFVEAVFILGIDHTVLVEVDVCALDRVAGCVIDLFVNIERAGSLAGLVNLHLVAATAGDSAGLDAVVVFPLVIGGQTGNDSLVVRGVYSESPAPVSCFDRNSVDFHLDTEVLEVADVGVQIVGKVGACCHGSPVQQVVSVALVNIEGTIEAVSEEAPVDTCVESCSGLPFEVGIVAVRGKRSYERVAEEVHAGVCIICIGSQ